ncbi:MAG: four helix bundle protein [Verrucomicrobiota bacterium]
MSDVRHFRDLNVYSKSFETAMRIFELSKAWPAAERYSLIDQIRRSSQSVSSNIAEAWRKRRYASHFVSKLSDSDSEAAETQVWLEFAWKSGYLSEQDFADLNEQYEAVSGGPVKMMTQPEKWCGVANLVKEETVTYDVGS